MGFFHGFHGFSCNFFPSNNPWIDPTMSKVRDVRRRDLPSYAVPVGRPKCGVDPEHAIGFNGGYLDIVCPLVFLAFMVF